MKNESRGNDNSNMIDLGPFIDAIYVRFRPALTAREATHHFSTAEIRQAIKDLNPSLEISEAQVYDAMSLAGFKFDALSGTQSLIFKWLLVEK